MQICVDVTQECVLNCKCEAVLSVEIMVVIV